VPSAEHATRLRRRADEKARYGLFEAKFPSPNITVAEEIRNTSRGRSSLAQLGPETLRRSVLFRKTGGDSPPPRRPAVFGAKGPRSRSKKAHQMAWAMSAPVSRPTLDNLEEFFRGSETIPSEFELLPRAHLERSYSVAPRCWASSRGRLPGP